MFSEIDNTVVFFRIRLQTCVPPLISDLHGVKHKAIFKSSVTDPCSRPYVSLKS